MKKLLEKLLKKSLLIFFILFFSNAFSQTWVNNLRYNVWAFGADYHENIYAAGLHSSLGRICKSTDYGISWDTIYIGPGQTRWGFAFDTLGNPGNMYVSNYSTGILKSTDAGLNFTVIPRTSLFSKFPQNIACTKSGIIFVTTLTGFLRSTNQGATFDSVLSGQYCCPILIDRFDENIVYIGGNSDGGAGNGFFRSTDGGVTFSENLNPGKKCENFCQTVSGDLYQVSATYPYNIDKSTNRGSNWTTISNAPDVPRTIIIDGLGHYFLGGEGGVYKSSNGGINWFNYNLHGTIRPIIIANKYLLAGGVSNLNGVYLTILPAITGVYNNQSNLITEDFTLYQIFPNPFNPATKIVYELKHANFVSLKIYDALGNEIREIDNGFKNAGKHEINFGGENLASGLYFARLNVNGNISTKKISLVK